MRIGRWYIAERYVHWAFQISLCFKAIFALLELAGGIAALFVTHTLLIRLANLVTQGELQEDPHDLVANYLLHTVQHLSIGTQHFTALYLISHGAIKLWLIIGLLRERLWYYPTALVVLSLFVVYQLYRFTFTHSPWLLMLTLVDFVVIALTWHEYRFLRGKLQADQGA